MATKRKTIPVRYQVERYEKTGAKRVVKRGLSSAEAKALQSTLAKKFTAAAFVVAREPSAPATKPRKRSRR